MEYLQWRIPQQNRREIFLLKIRLCLAIVLHSAQYLPDTANAVGSVFREIILWGLVL
jgi:hypothetical protein